MKSKRLLLFVGLLTLGLGILARRLVSAKATGLDRTESERLLASVRQVYTSTLSALEPDAEDAGEFGRRAAQAATDAEALQRALETVRPSLASWLSPTVSAFADAVTGAQVQIMASAINRKNRGTPDSAQTEAEADNLRAFQNSTEEVHAKLVSALG